MKNGLAVKIAAVCGGIVVLAAAAGGGLYWHESLKYKTRFLPGTVVNGIDVTGKQQRKSRKRSAQNLAAIS